MKHIHLLFILSFCLCASFSLHAQVDNPNKVDDDEDGLIDIWTLTDLNNMRYNLAGTSYRNSSEATGDSRGCPDKDHDNDIRTPQQPTCHGYELMANLDFTDKTATGYQADWDPVVQTAKQAPGAGWVPVGARTFDGNGHTIANLYVKTAGSAGLFRPASGKIKNLGLIGEHMSISSSASRSSYAGGLVGYVGSNATITMTNCYATGDVSASSSSHYSYAGGLVGYVGSNATITITNCYATGDVSASAASSSYYYSYAGGLVGYVDSNATITITDCYATGDVSASASSPSSSSYAGGLVGYIYSSDAITNCYATGDVSSASRSSYAGGLVGYIYSSATITNCYATGDVTSTADNAAQARARGLGGGAKRYCYYSGRVQQGTRGNLTNVTRSGSTQHATYKTKTQLKALTATSSGWGEKNWNFGTNRQLPRLRDYVPPSGGTEPKEHTISSLGKDMEALEQLVGSPTQDAAVDGSAYQRIKQLVVDVEAVKQQLDSSDGGDDDTALPERIAALEAWKQGLNIPAAYDDTGVREKIAALEAWKQGLSLPAAYDDTALREKIAALETWKQGLSLPTAYDDTALRENITALEARVDNLSSDGGSYDDTALRSKITALETWKSEMETKVAALESRNINAIIFTKEDLTESGIASGTTKKSLVIVPNPVQQTLALTLYQDYDYVILGSAGHTIKTGKTSEGRIEVSELRTGTYILQLKSATETYTLKFIKEHR